MSIRLADWQGDFADALDAANQTMPCITTASSDTPLPVDMGLAVYRQSSVSARRRALDEIYAVCCRLVGEACFDTLTREYVQRFASHSGDLNRYGESFPRFVDEILRREPGFADVPWLSDLAHLEWLCHLVYYRNDDAPFDAQRLVDIPPQQVMVALSSHVLLLRSDWPVHAIWQAHQQAHDTPSVTTPIVEGDWHLLVERRSFRAHVEAVDAETYRILTLLANARSISGLAERHDIEPTQLAGYLQRGWVRLGVGD